MKPHLLSLLAVVMLLTLLPAGAQTSRSPDLLDPGFNVFNATRLRAAGKYHLFIKDERKNPLKKNLRHAIADAPAGPFGSLSDPPSAEPRAADCARSLPVCPAHP